MTERGRTVPGLVGTANNTDATTALTAPSMSEADMIRLIRTVFKEEANTPRDRGSKPKVGDKTDSLRQWKFFCHTHGVNLTHSSGDCPRPNEGHNKEANKCSPLGGNENRNHLWMQWCEPVTHKAHPSPTN